MTVNNRDARAVQQAIKDLGITPHFQLCILPWDTSWSSVDYETKDYTLTYENGRPSKLFCKKTYHRFKWYVREQVFKCKKTKATYNMIPHEITYILIDRPEDTIRISKTDILMIRKQSINDYYDLELNSYGYHQYSYKYKDKMVYGIGYIEDFEGEEVFFQRSTITSSGIMISMYQPYLESLFSIIKT